MLARSFDFLLQSWGGEDHAKKDWFMLKQSNNDTSISHLN